MVACEPETLALTCQTPPVLSVRKSSTLASRSLALLNVIKRLALCSVFVASNQSISTKNSSFTSRPTEGPLKLLWFVPPPFCRPPTLSVTLQSPGCVSQFAHVGQPASEDELELDSELLSELELDDELRLDDELDALLRLESELRLLTELAELWDDELVLLWLLDDRLDKLELSMLVISDLDDKLLLLLLSDDVLVSLVLD